MKSSKELREQSAELLARVQAITETAKDEKRELSDEETAEVDRILGSGDEDKGEIGKIEAQIARAEKIEKRQAELAGRQAPAAPPQDPPQVRTAPQHRYHCRKLRAYEDGEQAFTAGMWLAATLCQRPDAQKWCSERGLNTQFRSNLFRTPQAAHAGDSNPSGGYLVPVEMERSIIKLREDYGVFRRNARVVAMATDTVDIPVRSSGLTGYWAADADSLTESTMTYKNASLVAKKLYAFCKYSSELAEDAIVDFGDELTDEMAHILAYNEDLAAFEGDGTSTYGGVVGIETALAAGSEVTAASGNTAFSTLDLADFENMIGAMPAYAGAQPKWYIHKKAWAASMLRLMDAAGGNTAMMLGSESRPPYFLGYPVEFTQVTNSTTTAQTSTEGLCFFGDLRLGALLGDRRGIAVAISDQRYFETDQLAIKATERISINIHGAGDSSNAGPIIQLLTPAS